MDPREDEIPGGESGHHLLSASNIQKQSNRTYDDPALNEHYNDFESNQMLATFPSTSVAQPISKRTQRHATRQKNGEQVSEDPTVFSPTL